MTGILNLKKMTPRFRAAQPPNSFSGESRFESFDDTVQDDIKEN